MSLLHERGSVGRGGEQVGIEVKSKEKMSLAEKRQLVKTALENGAFSRLNQNQQNILKIRGYLSEGPQRSFRKLNPEWEVLRIKYKTASAIETRALRRLQKLTENKTGRKKLRMTSYEQQFLLENPGLSIKQTAQQLGRNQKTIASWRDSLYIPRRPLGRPRGSNPMRMLKMDSQTRELLLECRDLPVIEISRMVSRSQRVVARWRDELGIPRGKEGRPRKKDVAQYREY